MAVLEIPAVTASAPEVVGGAGPRFEVGSYLFVCEGERGRALSLAAAALLRRHLPRGDGRRREAAWAVCDSRQVGPVWQTQRGLCAALQRARCEVAAAAEARCVQADDVRLADLVVPMDATSLHALHSLCFREPEPHALLAKVSRPFGELLGASAAAALRAAADAAAAALDRSEAAEAVAAGWAPTGGAAAAIPTDSEDDADDDADSESEEEDSSDDDEAAAAAARAAERRKAARAELRARSGAARADARGRQRARRARAR